MTGRNRINLLRAAGLLLGTGFLLFGMYRGEHLEVLGKAGRICLECIGIG